MEKIKNTKEYTFFLKKTVILVTLVFVLPFSVFADDYYGFSGDYGSGYSDSYGGYGFSGDYGSGYSDSYGGYGFSSDYDSGYSDNYGSYGFSDDYNDTYIITTGGYGYGDSYWISSGGYFSGYNNLSTYNYYNNIDSGVSTGGFYAGDNNISTYDYYNDIDSNISTGGFSAGDNNLTTYDYDDDIDLGVSTGGFSSSRNRLTTYDYDSDIDMDVSTGGFTNQVLSYVQTSNSVMPLAASVYLSDVPYTGVGDNVKIILFATMLVLWSMFLAYYLLRKRMNSIQEVATVESNNTDSKDSFKVQTDFIQTVELDNKALTDIEDYARMNKVILSSSATEKILKLSRLGKAKANEVIKSLSTGEWVAVGEEEIK